MSRSLLRDHCEAKLWSLGEQIAIYYVPEDPEDSYWEADVELAALSAAGEAGIAPEVEGRICSSDRPDGPCLA